MAHTPDSSPNGTPPPRIGGRLRRYVQATARAERHRLAYEAAVQARGEHLTAILAAGISQRYLAAVTGLSRRRIRDLVGGLAEDQLVVRRER